jgi:hypothetical protein
VEQKRSRTITRTSVTDYSLYSVLRSVLNILLLKTSFGCLLSSSRVSLFFFLFFFLFSSGSYQGLASRPEMY